MSGFRIDAINNFKNIELTQEEMENIFIPEKRRVCQTCHKVRIKKKIDRIDFSPEHRIFICKNNHRNQNNNNQQNQAGNLNQNGNNQGDNNNLNNIGQDNFGAQDNNDNINDNVINYIPNIQYGINAAQPNNHGANIDYFQNQNLIIQNNNNNNNGQNNNNNNNIQNNNNNEQNNNNDDGNNNQNNYNNNNYQNNIDNNNMQNNNNNNNGHNNNNNMFNIFVTRQEFKNEILDIKNLINNKFQELTERINNNMNEN